MIFTVQDRQETFDFILSIAKACEKIVALVQVGSGAVGFTDDHSDLDFVVALDSNDSMKEVMDYFHQKVFQKYEIVYFGQIEQRRLEVFVLSNLLEIDLGFGCYEQAAAMKPAFKVLYDKTGVVEQKMIDSRKWMDDVIFGAFKVLYDKTGLVEQKMIDSRKWMDDAIFGDKQKKDIEFICSLVWHRLMQTAVAINRGALLRARGIIEYVRSLYVDLLGDRYKLESKLNREMDKLPPEEIAKIKSTFIIEDTPDAMWVSLLRLTDLIYKELEGQPISISKEMLLEYYEDLK